MDDNDYSLDRFQVNKPFVITPAKLKVLPYRNFPQELLEKETAEDERQREDEERSLQQEIAQLQNKVIAPEQLQQQEPMIAETPKSTVKKRGRPSKKDLEAEKQRVEQERLEKERFPFLITFLA